jgi:CheY-like chemotaxis protein
VEDEPMVLQYATAQLISFGHEVSATSAGPDALLLLEKDRSFDLLFSDVVLPNGMSGVELARRAQALKPEIRVLLTSGYSEDAFRHYGRPEPGTILLRKPYRRSVLADAIRRALQQE